MASRAKTVDAVATSGEAGGTQEEKHAGLSPVVVCTSHRGVFFGFADPLEVESGSSAIRLKSCRMITWWSADAHGVVGLAAKGPGKQSKVGPSAPRVTLRDVTCVMTCSAEAVAAWEEEPWGR